MSNEQDINEPPRIRRASNRIGLEEIDRDGTRWLSSGKVYTCRGAITIGTEEAKEQ